MREKIDQLNAITLSNININEDFPDNEQIISNCTLMYFEKLNLKIDSRSNDQKSLSSFSNFFRQINTFQQARKQNCTYLSHLSMLLKFVFLNWSEIPYAIFLTVFCGITGSLPVIFCDTNYKI